MICAPSRVCPAWASNRLNDLVDLDDRWDGYSEDDFGLGGELVVERAGVERFDVIEHVLLAYIDGPERGEFNARRGLLAGPPVGYRGCDGSFPVDEGRALGVDVGNVDDRPVARDDVIDVEASDDVQ